MNIAESQLYGDKLLVSVFAKFIGNKFSIQDESEIINAFYEASISGKYDALFVNYSFDVKGLYVRSINIEEAIDSMQQTRLLGRSNPDLKKYEIHSPVKLRYEKFIKNKLDAQSIALLDQLSEEIKEKLNIQNQ